MIGERAAWRSRHQRICCLRDRRCLARRGGNAMRVRSDLRLRPCQRLTCNSCLQLVSGAAKPRLTLMPVSRFTATAQAGAAQAFSGRRAFGSGAARGGQLIARVRRVQNRVEVVEHRRWLGQSRHNHVLSRCRANRVGAVGLTSRFAAHPPLCLDPSLQTQRCESGVENCRR